MKHLFFMLVISSLVIFASYCRRAEPVNCANGYSSDSNDNCSCPPGSIETYGQCLPDDNTVLFGVSEGCPCEQDSLLIKILGRTTNPNSLGRYQLNLQIVSKTGIIGGTGMEFVSTPFGYDSLITGVGPSSGSNCEIDGWSYQQRYSGRVYGNDSIVLHFFYTRPDPAVDDGFIIAPQTCGMVVRN
jgi:hypothetical protein